VIRLTGTSVRRVEDRRLLTGRGSYVDDLRFPGMVHAAFARSPLAHARVGSIDIEAALAIPGVLAVLTDSDLRAVVSDLDPTPMPNLVAPSYPALARDKVRFVGEPVAVVVAESRYAAEDAAAVVDVTYEPLAPLVDMDDALGDSAPVLFEDAGTNVVHRSRHVYGEPDVVLASAPRVVSERFFQHRHANVPMEGRGGVAVFSPADGSLDYHTAHQAPHGLRVKLAALLGQPTHLLRVRCGDIGGSFGQKGGIGREDVVVCASARLLGRPVKWIEDRNENLTVAGQAREERLDVSAAVDDAGNLLALKVRMVMDQGAYPQLGFPVSGYPSVVRALMPAAYRLEHFDFEAVVVATNKASYVPYRGPWEVETWVRERLLDVIARTVGVDPVEVRLRNLLTDDELPRESCTGAVLTGITQRQTLTDACRHIGYDEFRARQAAEREAGRYVGIGVACYVEPAPVPPSLIKAMGFMAAPRTVQEARARLEPDGSITVFTSQQPHGQSHETTLAQLAADELGVPLERVRVVHGDTQVTPFNMVGTGGSRAATLASGAVVGVARAVRSRILDVASTLLEIAPDDLELVDGAVMARGAPARAVPLASLASATYLQPGLASPDGALGIEERATFISGEGTWSQATHCCTVAVDVDTGRVAILRYVVVEDCGSIVNPAIVDGQIRGGVAQGIGAVLLERSAYGDDGQYLAGTFMDYLLPTATDIPPIEIHHLESQPAADINFRGVGEGGAIGAPAAVTNAIEDALAPFGVRIREQHLPPSRIVELCSGG
jgi:aerobic carbon-monoxide dehydrogenase large subunit